MLSVIPPEVAELILNLIDIEQVPQLIRYFTLLERSCINIFKSIIPQILVTQGLDLAKPKYKWLDNMDRIIYDCICQTIQLRPYYIDFFEKNDQFYKRLHGSLCCRHYNPKGRNPTTGKVTNETKCKSRGQSYQIILQDTVIIDAYPEF